MRFVRAFQLATALSLLGLLSVPVLADQPGGGPHGVATPRPTPRPTPTPRPQPIPAPSSLADTRDPQVCGTHAGPLGSLVCVGAFTGGSLVLVFDWTGDKAYPTPDGFNVFEVDNGLHKLVDHNTTQATVGFVKRPKGGFANRCYAVTAVVGKQQSKLSRWACLSGGQVGPFTTVITANTSAVRTQSQATENVPQPVPFGPGFPCTNAAPCVGGLYNYETERGAPQSVIEELAGYYRAYFHFNLDPSLKKTYFIKATLSDKTTKAFAYSTRDYCISALGPASSDWMSGAGGINDIVGGDFSPVDGTLLAYGIDVSTTVHSWIDGSAPNNGFVLRGKLEKTSYTTFPSIYCVWQLDKNAKLSIVHS